MDDETRVWGLHCNENLDLIGSGVAAMGWDELSDLTRLDPTRASFRDAMSSAYPDAKAGTISQWAGQLFRFVHAAQDGDLVVYRESGGGPVNIGRLAGGYTHAEGELYSQRRPVEWVLTGLVPSRFPPGALYELGAYLTWFRLKRFAAVWIATLGGETQSPKTSATTDASDGDAAGAGEQLDAAAIEQGTRDFLTRRLATHFKGHAFARLTAHLLEQMGYVTTVSPPGKDHGVDIVAHRGPLGLEPPFIKVQAKSTEGSVGSPPVAELLGRLTAPGEAGLFVTLGHYSPDARKLGAERANLTLIDGSAFVDLLLAHYSELDEEYRARFPLRRVWARDLAAEAAEDDA